MPTVFNSADEVAVELFLNKKIGYLEITDSINEAMEKVKNIENPTVEQILEADKFAREAVYNRS